jgi:type IV secretory pathway VirB10-like protein
LNVMRRSRPEESDQFLQLGVALREAHRTLDREQLRRLTGEQWRVVSALARETAALAGQAGHRLSDPVQRDVESTLRAVLADQAAADRWASGRLDATLTPPTLLPTPGTAPAPPPEPAVARPSRPLTRSRHDDELEQRRRERADRARQDLQAASSALTGARQTQADAEAALDAARGREQQAERELGAARQQLQKAEEERAAVGGAVKKATVARRAASTAVAKAERDRAAARAVDKLTP